MDRTVAWQALHSADTDAETLARIAGEYPEFALQIASHPQCYDELALWARSVAATGAAAETDSASASSPAEDAGGSGLRPGVWIGIAAGAVAVIAVGGGVWGLMASGVLGNGVGSPLDAGTAADAERPELDGPEVYVGDELEWFLPEDSQLRVLFPGVGSVSRGAELGGIGEGEGVHTGPEECSMWFWGDDWAVVGLRTASWDNGAVAVRGFPTDDEAEHYFGGYSETIDSCADFAILGPDEAEYGRVFIESLDVPAGTESLVAVRRTEGGEMPPESGDDTLELLSLEGNTVTTVSVVWDDGFSEASELSKIVAAVVEQRDEAFVALADQMALR
ncbi:MAG: hypothetical protein DBW62_00180 [Microbacterium sp.]|nr:MAG: hypothetical protein DBW62_00180 [Microbacterium sp.]